MNDNLGGDWILGIVYKVIAIVTQSINDAVSSTFTTVIAGLVVAGVGGLVVFCIWSASAISGLQTDMQTVKHQVELIYERTSKP